MGLITSRGASEWSGGKESYKGKHFLGSGKVRNFSGSVSEGSRRFRKVPLWVPPAP
jgi:hypothetical protein